MVSSTFTYVSSYPPQVLSDYTSEVLDLTDEKVFRDLKKPSKSMTAKDLIPYENPVGTVKPRLIFRAAIVDLNLWKGGLSKACPGVILFFFQYYCPLRFIFSVPLRHAYHCCNRKFFDMDVVRRVARRSGVKRKQYCARVSSAKVTSATNTSLRCLSSLPIPCPLSIHPSFYFVMLRW